MDLLGGYSDSDEDAPSVPVGPAPPPPDDDEEEVPAPVPAPAPAPAPVQPPPKKKLPSAAALLKAMPQSHTYAGFRPPTDPAVVDGRVDPVGTKYNTSTRDGHDARDCLCVCQCSAMPVCLTLWVEAGLDCRICFSSLPLCLC
jgi:hypothetical protein